MLPFVFEYDDNPDRAPWHEAAHITVALCIGMRTVASGLAWTQGEDRTPNPTTWVSITDISVEDRAAQLLAGGVGEVLKLGDFNAVTIGSDLRKFAELKIENEEPIVERVTAILQENDALFTRISEALRARYTTPTRASFKDTGGQKQVMLDEFDILDLKENRPLTVRKDSRMKCMSEVLGLDGSKHTEPSGEWFADPDTPTVSFEACKNHLQALQENGEHSKYVLVPSPESGEIS